jgi:hypothetical protein
MDLVRTLLTPAGNAKDALLITVPASKLETLQLEIRYGVGDQIKRNFVVPVDEGVIGGTGRAGRDPHVSQRFMVV